MCTYNTTLDDKLVNRIRPSFLGDAALERWLQLQIEEMLAKLYVEQQNTLACARESIEAMRIQSEQNGNSEMTLDEINEEIRLVRAERKASAR